MYPFDTQRTKWLKKLNTQETAVLKGQHLSKLDKIMACSSDFQIFQIFYLKSYCSFEKF